MSSVGPSASVPGGLSQVGAKESMSMTSLYANKARGSLKVDPIVNLADQTMDHPDGGRVIKNLKDGQLQRYLYEDAQTLYQGFRRGARESISGQCLGYRKKMEDGTEPFLWISYQDVLTRAERLAAGMSSQGVEVGQEAFVGVFAKNRPEWIITEQACYINSRVLVPLYDTLGPEASAFIINKMNMSIVFCDEDAKAQGLIKQKATCPTLKVIVVMDEISDKLSAAAKENDLTVLSFKQMEEIGARVHPPPKHQPPSPSDLATVCFTSGTTGMPKGVMLTHENIVSDCTPFSFLKYISFTPEDVLLSFLPLAHMFERVVEAVMYMHGCRVGFFRGDIKLLTEDIKELRPTLLVVVPRLLNRIYDKVMGEANKSGVKKQLIKWAIKSKTNYLDKQIIRNDTLWDQIVFKKIREAMGGRVKLMISGSAPLAENVLTFMRAAMGCVILEGYGQTESCAAASVTVEGDHAPGHVGVPIPCCSIKLDDVPDMNYYAKDGKGEICIKGYNVSPGYYKDEAKTAETFDKQGWLHTGDIGMWTPEGTVKIIDRKKHIFKLSQGEYIAPEKIENIYSASKYVAQVFVYGESLKSSLVAIIVPDPDVMKDCAQKEFGLKGDDMKELCSNGSVKKAILDDIVKIGKEKKLHSFEQVKDIHLHSELFSVENNLLTPTFKSKRPELKKFFLDVINQMYANLI